MMRLLHEEVTDEILNAFYHVYNTLGYGFLEKVYENALGHELRRRGLQVATQQPITVWYEGVPVGEYYADMLVNDAVLLELKCAVALMPAHEAQLINYLKATRIQVGLLLNFGPKPEIKRKVFGLASVSPSSNSNRAK